MYGGSKCPSKNLNPKNPPKRHLQCINVHEPLLLHPVHHQAVNIGVKGHSRKTKIWPQKLYIDTFYDDVHSVIKWQLKLFIISWQHFRLMWRSGLFETHWKATTNHRIHIYVSAKFALLNKDLIYSTHIPSRHPASTLPMLRRAPPSLKTPQSSQ